MLLFLIGVHTQPKKEVLVVSRVHNLSQQLEQSTSCQPLLKYRHHRNQSYVLIELASTSLLPPFSIKLG